ncbi:MAG: thiolase C-terminal domain-containing protein [Thermodesulfobacteriota bacterium]
MAKKKKLSRGVAVVGGGLSKLGLFKDRNCKDFFAEAYLEMLQSVDKGIDPRDIEAIYIGNFSNDFFVKQAHWGPIIADLVGHVPKPVTRTEGACASSALAFREGVFAIASGFYDIVLVGGIEQMSKRTTEEVTEGLGTAGSPYEVATGFTFPGVFGTIATAYFAKYGAKREDLFNVTIKSHNNAPLNPKAQFPMTVRDFMNARIERCRQKGEPIPTWKDEKDFLRDVSVNPPIAWPMHLFDCCPISDGASCLLLVAEEIAKNFTDNPIYVAGIGQGSGYSLHATKDLTSFEATRQAAKEAYEMSGLTPADVQFSEVHDCFSIAEIIHMEDLGFCRPGEAYKAVAEGFSRLDGPKPINTSGGLKAKGHPVGATGVAQLYEVWLQLRGQAGARQIPNPNLRVGGAHNLGGTGGTCTFVILERR